MAPVSRPRLEPSPCFDVRDDDTLTLRSPTSTTAWTPVISCSAPFPEAAFDSAVYSFITQPEQNSTLILRAEIVSDVEYSSCEELAQERFPSLVGLRVTRAIRRVLLPRRPARDSSIIQDCIFYAGSEHDASTSCLVLTPLVEDGKALPYYHPAVRHLAFRFFDSTLRIEAVLLPDSPALSLESRLYRTCLALLDTLHRYMWGHVSNWQKRVQHDILVPRNEYQDLYLIMRERHKHLASEWKEDTDPTKHVFEELGIAVYLMLLWKTTYAASVNAGISNGAALDEPWRSWPRPPGGFLDLGCGAGMLTHVLVAEGYSGHGIDVRARKSWEYYPKATRESLHVHPLDPTHVLDDEWESARFFPDGVFLIGNHSDELTPWLPVLGRMTRASAYLSIPCCAWTLDAKFERSHAPDLPETGDRLEIASLHIPVELNPSAGQSSYEAYRTWLGRLSLVCGWKIEADVLRIPSTRNWALVGRASNDIPEEEVIQAVRDLVQEVVDRGVFRARAGKVME
ncbi:DUF1613-domain-containing protein [Exidia glandulosa HHB12029]|uniref:tRNA (uracil-O(2)-)-methyltransferase n=1 Tax=Exidia glandulosa HHB12029 TaxID=1314781 RepID=A0A165KDY5_EXIGL|nr:DUF1613-domain-containing protein [Exidia glandulosa HHB12029]